MRPLNRPPSAVALALFAIVTGLAIAGAAIAAGHDGGRPVPTARAPLLRSLPSTTKVIVLSAGHRGSFAWKLKAKVNPSAHVPGPGSADFQLYSSQANLCFGVSLSFAGSYYCTSPRSGPSLVWASDGPPNTSRSLPAGKAIVYGVTSAAAARITITLADTGRTITVGTVRTPAIPGLRFFDALVPSGHETTVEAVAADGTPIERGHTGLVGGHSPKSRSFHS